MINPGDDYNGGGNGFGSQMGSSSGGGGAAGIALLQLGAGLYDSHQNRKTSKENTNKTIAAQKREAELAYQRSVEMWHQQNAYNSPQAQMQRFLEAGLNPHLIYGQGSSGNASAPPNYQPANLQYRYEAPTYGAAIQSVLPTLMAVGSWVQNMRASEASIRKTQTETDRAQQMVDYLTQKNPKALQELDNRLSLFPYQSQMQQYLRDSSHHKLFEMESEFRQKYGDELFSQMGSAFQPRSGKFSDIGGTKRLEFLQQASKTKLLQAQSSWTDFSITNPQSLIQMVLGMVGGMAGQTLRLSTHKRPKTTRETTETLRNGRTKTRRYIQE